MMQSETRTAKDGKMLVLSRRLNEAVIINDNIRVVIVGINGNRIRIGIEAPEGVTVNREEVWKKLKEKTVLDEKE